jgi:hypothetical protein
MDVNQRLTLQLPHPPLGYPYGLTPPNFGMLAKCLLVEEAGGLGEFRRDRF